MVRSVPHEILQQRFESHYLYAEVFLEEWASLGDRPRMAINDNSLYLAVKSAYDDIYRYKDYHLRESQRSNGVKRAAYLCKWICKFRPIECIDGSIKSTPKSVAGLLVNADFAQFLAKVHISLDSKDLRHFQFSDEYLKELLYDLTYREMNGDALLHIFQNVYTSVIAEKALYEPV